MSTIMPVIIPAMLHIHFYLSNIEFKYGPDTDSIIKYIKNKTVNPSLY